jgi:hypothetical protein
MVSALIVFLNLLQIAAVGSITVLFIHAVTHLGRLKVIKETKTSKFMVITALLTTLGACFLVYSIEDSYSILNLFLGVLALSF